MPNAKAHRIGAALTIGAVIHQHEKSNDKATLKPLLGAGIAAAMGTLPDIIEPAYHPNHRQFFHSIAMFSLIGSGLYKLSQWEPEDNFDKTIKFLSMVAAGSYLVHLAMDSSTPKSLPWLGKI